jgi:hypothetical protein
MAVAARGGDGRTFHAEGSEYTGGACQARLAALEGTTSMTGRSEHRWG